MIAAFILFLREGLEAFLIISILLTALRQLGQRRQARAVLVGAGLALLGSLAGGAIIYATVRAYDGTTFEGVFEVATYLVAVVLLTSMTFWMQQHSRTMKRELTEKASAAGSGFAFGLLAFSSVGREGLETAIFTVAIAFSNNALQTLSGAVLGLLAAVGLCALINRLGYRLDFRVFFRVMGALLLIFAAGLLGNAIDELQERGWITFGSTRLWDVSGALPDTGPFGSLLHSLFGYTADPSALQVSLYVLFLAIFGGVFVWMTRKPARPAIAQSQATNVPTQRA